MKKKIFILAVLIYTLTVFSACSNKLDVSGYVSELRLDIFSGESASYSVVAYSEKREYPFISDGSVGEVKSQLTIKLTQKQKAESGLKALAFFGNKEYEANFTYNVVNSSMIAVIEVDKFPSSSFTLSVVSQSGSENVTLTSLKHDEVISYKDALESVVEYDEDKAKNLFKEKGLAEIHIRIMESDDKNYYYVGLVEKEGKTSAYLVDGYSGEVLATKYMK